MNAFEGIDTDGIARELSGFLEQTAPKRSGSAYKEARCGRERGVQFTERVRPILDALYPRWEEQNPVNPFFEFGHIRDACFRLQAQLASRSEIDEMLAGQDASPQLSASALHPQVWTSASAQWATGHRHEAVLAAAKTVNSMLQAKLERRDVSEVALVQEAFSQRAPSQTKPRLRFGAIEDEKTRDSVTKGALSFGVGCFQAIRNPLGHLPNEQNELTEQEALERLAALSLFARWIEEAGVERASK